MAFRVFALIIALSAWQVLAAPSPIIERQTAKDLSSASVEVRLDLSSYLNNKGTSSGPGQADFNGIGWSIPYAGFPTSLYPYRGISFVIPDNWETAKYDNVLCTGQTVAIPETQAGRYQSLYLLTTTDYGTYTNNISFAYADGTTESVETLIPGWKNWPYPSKGEINADFAYTSDGIDPNSTHIHAYQIPLDPAKSLSSIVLPKGDNSGARLHIFSATLWTSAALTNSSSSPSAAQPALAVEYVRTRNQWFNDSGSGSDHIQVVDVAISNLPSDFNDPAAWLDGSYTVEITSDSLTTTRPGVLKRLRPGDQARVQLGVVNVDGVARGTAAKAKAVVKDGEGNVVATSAEFGVTAGIPVYTDDPGSLLQHEAPRWFEDAKFGIFVHWGIYSVPAYAPSGKQYAEWYWWQIHDVDGPTYNYALETYGPDHLYDDFIDDFNPVNFSADAMVDLFNSAGAKYFVIVSKHHDGFAMFDTGATSNRSSVALGPKRDFLKEIFDAAEKRHPEMVPATFNPDWAKYGFAAWPGGLSHNPFNSSQLEPYTGHIPVDDYIQDVQTPQMNILLNDYGSNILWCDIGGTTNVSLHAAEWYNKKYDQGINMAVDDRCAIYQWDFSTPEYATYAVTQQTKWESNSGLDPFSYGYNAQTPDANYLKPEDAVPRLVDIVSKNGNWLLDIGPTGDGRVVAPAIATLNAIGEWLEIAGAAIYSTQYWLRTPQEGNLRFTTTPDAFYITSLVNPSPSFSVTSPVPLKAADTIRLLGGSGAGLNFTISDAGVVNVVVPEAEAALVKYAWAFEIRY